MEGAGTWLVWLTALAGVYVGLRLLAEPARYASLLLLRGAAGYLALWSLNLVGNLLGYHLPLNPVTALVTGILGVPGVGLVVAFRLMYASI